MQTEGVRSSSSSACARPGSDGDDDPQVDHARLAYSRRAHRLPPAPAPRRGRHGRGATSPPRTSSATSRPRAEARDRGARRLRAHLPLPPGARRLAPPLLGRAGDRRPRRLLRVRAHDAAAARDRGRLRARAPRTGSPTCSRLATFDYVVGSVHFLGDGAVDDAGLRRLGGRRRPRRASGAATSSSSPRRRARASSTSSPTPTWSRSGAASGRGPTATRASTTSPRSRRSPRPASRSRSRPRACASRSASSIRRRRSPRCASRRGRVRALLRRPRARAGRLRLRRALEFLAELGRRARSASSRAASAAWSRSAMSCPRRDRLRLPPLRRGRRADPRRGRDPARAAASRATPTPTSLTHAVIDALLGAGGLGDLGTHFPSERGALARRRLDRPAAQVRRRCSPGARQRRRHADLRASRSWPPPRARWSAPRRGASAPGQRQGDDQRGHGRDRPRRGDRLLRGRARRHRLSAGCTVMSFGRAMRSERQAPLDRWPAGQASARSGPLSDVPFNVRTLPRPGVIRPMRPDKLARMSRALRAGAPRRRRASRPRRSTIPTSRDRSTSSASSRFARAPQPLQRARPRRSPTPASARATASRSCAATTATSSRRRWRARSSAPSRLYLNTAFAAPQLAEVIEREEPAALIYDEEFAELLARRARRQASSRFVAWSDGRARPTTPRLEELIEATPTTPTSTRPTSRAAS